MCDVNTIYILYILSEHSEIYSLSFKRAINSKKLPHLFIFTVYALAIHMSNNVEDKLCMH